MKPFCLNTGFIATAYGLLALDMLTHMIDRINEGNYIMVAVSLAAAVSWTICAIVTLGYK